MPERPITDRHPLRSTQNRRGICSPVVAVASLAIPLALGGCGPAQSPPESADGRRTSIPGKALDRAEDVVKQIDENQQRALDIAEDFPGGRTRPEEGSSVDDG